MRYSASAKAIGPAGRSVRCASCGHNWAVDGQGKEKTEEKPAPPPKVEEPVEEVAAPVDTKSEEANKEPEETKPPKAEAKAETPRDPKVAQALRARRVAAEQQQKRMRMMGIWGAIGACFVVVLSMSWVFKVSVVRVWPQTASAYAAFGGKVNLYGLEIQDIAAQRQTKEGGSMLQIRGHVVNITKKTQNIPFLQAKLLDEHGAMIFTWNVQPAQEQLDGHAKLAFVTEVRDPPPGALHVEMIFVEEQKKSNKANKKSKPKAKPTKTKHKEKAKHKPKPKPAAHH